MRFQTISSLPNIILPKSLPCSSLRHPALKRKVNTASLYTSRVLRGNILTPASHRSSNDRPAHGFPFSKETDPAPQRFRIGHRPPKRGFVAVIRPGAHQPIDSGQDYQTLDARRAGSCSYCIHHFATNCGLEIVSDGRLPKQSVDAPTLEEGMLWHACERMFLWPIGVTAYIVRRPGNAGSPRSLCWL